MPQASAPTAPAQVRFTLAQIKEVAAVGLNSAEILWGATQIETSFLSSLLAGFGTGPASGSSTVPVTTSCISGGVGSGTFGGAVTKAGSYAGLRANDTISLTFANCKFGTDPVTLNGSFLATALADISNLNTTNFNLNFAVTTTNFEYKTDGVKLRSNGTFTATANTLVGGSAGLSATTVAGSGRSFNFFTSVNDTNPSFNLTLGSGTTIVANKTVNKTYTSKTDGNITGSTAAGPVPLTFVNSTPLTGNFASTSTIVGTGGVIRVTDTELNLLTEVTVLGVIAVLKGATLPTGSLDLTTTTTYQAIRNNQ